MLNYLHNILIAIDQFLNSISGGNPDETISSRMGKQVAHSRAARIACRIVGFFLGHNHCQEAIEPDEQS